MRSAKHLAATVLVLFVVPILAANVAAQPPSGFRQVSPSDLRPVVFEDVKAVTVTPYPSPTPQPISVIVDSWPKPTVAPRPSVKPAPATPKATQKAKATPRPKFVAVANGKYGKNDAAREAARAYARSRISATQYRCLYHLWNHESGWRWWAGNRQGSGAYGIPQALPGSKMKSAGADWRTNPITQVKWGLGYISRRYGSSCAAWSFWQSHNWY